MTPTQPEIVPIQTVTQQATVTASPMQELNTALTEELRVLKEALQQKATQD